MVSEVLSKLHHGHEHEPSGRDGGRAVVREEAGKIQIDENGTQSFSDSHVRIALRESGMSDTGSLVRNDVGEGSFSDLSDLQSTRNGSYSCGCYDQA